MEPSIQPPFFLLARTSIKVIFPALVIPIKHVSTPGMNVFLTTSANPPHIISSSIANFCGSSILDYSHSIHMKEGRNNLANPNLKILFLNLSHEIHYKDVGGGDINLTYTRQEQKKFIWLIYFTSQNSFWSKSTSNCWSQNSFDIQVSTHLTNFTIHAKLHYVPSQNFNKCGVTLGAE